MVDRLHPVMNVEHLTFAQHLTADCGRYRLLVNRPDIGEDGVAILGRGSDMADLTNPGEGHFQRARNRRRRQREHID